jgi:hypothetical protein
MVADGSAEAVSGNGKVRTIRLLRSAQSHGELIGKAVGVPRFGTHFVYLEHLPESGAKVWTFRRLD